MIEHIEAFGLQLKTTRIQNQIFFDELVKVLNTRRRRIQDWEEALCFPEESRLSDIAKAYGMTEVEYSILAATYTLSKTSRYGGRWGGKVRHVKLSPDCDVFGIGQGKCGRRGARSPQL
ncbi:hypothetical protein H0W91_04220 [Patescibacteria group bacterium]|nr:hypothetical protein [Patescibacteria group bacterium]